MQRHVWALQAIAQLWAYADSWARIDLPAYKRNALRCKTMALINMDRLYTNHKGI